MGSYVKIDYFIKELNVGIEYNGDFWHANPKKYKALDIPNSKRNDLTAKDIWEKDSKRIKSLREEYDIQIIVIWESELPDPKILYEQILKLSQSTT